MARIPTSANKITINRFRVIVFIKDILPHPLEGGTGELNSSCDILPPMSKLSPLDHNFSEGIRLFNDGKYFDAHEALESAWRQENGPIRDLYRGILQVAVCYLHITRRNYDGAIKMYYRSLKWLTPWPDVILGINISQLKSDSANAITELRRLGQTGIEDYDLSLLKPITYDQTNSIGRKQSAEKIQNLVCDRCGFTMIDDNCKITCPNCGNRFDCSDLNIYFD